MQLLSQAAITRNEPIVTIKRHRRFVNQKCIKDLIRDKNIKENIMTGCSELVNSLNYLKKKI